MDKGVETRILDLCCRNVGRRSSGQFGTVGMKYLNGQLPAWWYKVWKTLTTVALDKGDGALRPVGIEPCLARSLHKVVTRKNRDVLTSYLEPQQVALSVAGGAKLVHSVRMLAEANPEFVVVKCNIKNAFNSISRGRILEVLEGKIV